MNFKNGYKPLCDGLKVGPGVHGNGIIATEDFKAGVFLGETHIWESNRREWIRTPLGGFLNHSDTPNCQKIEVDGRYYIQTLRDIKEGEELTLKYTLYNV